MDKALPYLLLIGVVCANIAANVLIKLGANSVALSSGLMALVNPRVIDAAAARAVLPLGIWLIHRALGTSGFLTLRHPRAHAPRRLGG